MFRQVAIDPLIETQSVHLLIIVIHVADTENLNKDSRGRNSRGIFIATISLVHST